MTRRGVDTIRDALWLEYESGRYFTMNRLDEDPVFTRVSRLEHKHLIHKEDATIWILRILRILTASVAAVVVTVTLTLVAVRG